MKAKLEDMRWRAIRERDGSQDGVFVFAVLTTGIYCSPGCTARRPKRENVVFYNAPHLAEAAGYRPCKRCRPHQNGASPHIDAIVRACRLLCSTEEEQPLSKLAEHAGLSPSHFQRIFKNHLGLSPKEYARAARKQRLRASLGNARNITDAIFAAGYASASRAYADEAASGVRFSLYRRGARGETIFYATAATSLGEILIAATGDGICLVEFLDFREVETALRERFAFAKLQRAGENQTNWIREVISCVDGSAEVVQKRFGDAGRLPLDIRGTAFQEIVWRALIEIPKGETRSYGDLARELGRPQSARAIGAACAANPVAVVVPCHRIVGAKGELTGYRWGVGRKRELLRREKAGRGGKHP